MRKKPEILILIGITICVMSILIPINKDIITDSILRNIIYSRGILFGLLTSIIGCSIKFYGTIRNISIALGGGIAGIIIMSTINIIYGGLDPNKNIFLPDLYYLRIIQMTFAIYFIIIIIKLCSKNFHSFLERLRYWLK